MHLRPARYLSICILGSASSLKSAAPAVVVASVPLLKVIAMPCWWTATGCYVPSFLLLNNISTTAAAAACVECGYAALASGMPLAVNRHADQHLGGCACAAATCAHLCPCCCSGMPNAAAEAVAAFFPDMVHAASRLLTRPLLSTGMLRSARRSRTLVCQMPSPALLLLSSLTLSMLRTGTSSTLCSNWLLLCV